VSRQPLTTQPLALRSRHRDRQVGQVGVGEGCVFCHPEPALVLDEDADIRLIWDAFPVTPGHLLVTPRRHVAGWFEATEAEHLALLRGLERARRAIVERYGATDFNIGVNVGEAAGQTVPHLHVHVIPRRPGDVTDPRGGVRHVIPERGNYLRAGPDTEPASEAASAADRIATAFRTIAANSGSAACTWPVLRSAYPICVRLLPSARCT
jgi:diadenosine tetraphosphate (Ap4A) HIT family hydrolase